MESQIDRIRKAEEAIRELLDVAAELRQEVQKLPIEKPDVREELLNAAEDFERQAADLKHALKSWREDIN